MGSMSWGDMLAVNLEAHTERWYIVNGSPFAIAFLVVWPSLEVHRSGFGRGFTMQSSWINFFELVERLQHVSPQLGKLALKYGHGKDQEVLKEVEGELERRSEEQPSELFFEHSQKVNLRRCKDFLEDLRKQEDKLRKTQVEATQDLLRIQAAKRAFEGTLKEMLRAERGHFPLDKSIELFATEEEVMAGLQDLKEHGGLELHQFIGELEQACTNMSGSKSELVPSVIR
jgi:hypothetical protein